MPTQISIHPPVWGGTKKAHRQAQFEIFQSTHPYGVGQSQTPNLKKGVYFNPPTRMGWDYTWYSRFKFKRHFNPPTRMGWDKTTASVQLVTPISIHPPVWGGTCSINNKTPNKKFQSTHPYGVGLEFLNTFFWLQRFQSTHPYGVGPQDNESDASAKRFQSTHPYGVGLLGFDSPASSKKYFNPPTRMGWDVSYCLSSLLGFSFQSTHPYGVGRQCKSNLVL